MAARIIHGVEELRTLLGQQVGASDWIEITQKMIDGFADLTGDDQWIHIDVERTKRESPFGGPIAHGFLTVSLLSKLTREAVDVRGDYRLRVNYGFNRLRFPAPVPAGSLVRALVKAEGLKDIEGGIEVSWGVNVEISGMSKPALAAEWITRMYH